MVRVYHQHVVAFWFYDCMILYVINVIQRVKQKLTSSNCFHPCFTSLRMQLQRSMAAWTFMSPSPGALNGLGREVKRSFHGKKGLLGRRFILQVWVQWSFHHFIVFSWEVPAKCARWMMLLCHTSWFVPAEQCEPRTTDPNSICARFCEKESIFWNSAMSQDPSICTTAEVQANEAHNAYRPWWGGPLM